MTSLTLFHGPYEETLAGVQANHLITDPPYGGRTHKGYDSVGDQIRSATGQRTRNVIGYTHWSPTVVRGFVAYWANRVSGWMVCFTSHDLIPAYMEAYEAAGRYAFAPVAFIERSPRLLGDGPSSWVRYIMISRPRSRKWLRNNKGCRPGAYLPPTDGPIRDRLVKKHLGAKPVWLMKALINDYSHPGDIIVDPCAGSGTTLKAAHDLGRHSIGSEIDSEAYERAREALVL